MKRIAIFMHNFNGGGAERVTILLANELIARNYNVTMIIRENKGILEKELDSKVKIIKLNLEKENKILKNIKNIKLLKKIIEKEKYDCMFSISAPMSLIAEISNFFANNRVKLFCVMHSTISMEKKKLKKLRYFLMRHFDKYSRKTIVVSEDARLDYVNTIKIPEDKTVTIYNPVITKEFDDKLNGTIDEEWLEEERKFKTIINIGRLTYAKNQELLLEAIASIRKTENIRLIILGEGELRSKLEEAIKEKGLKDIVKLKGFVNNPEVYLKKADLFVLSSIYEGLPTVIIEALAAGCKVVSTNCKTGPREILEDGKYGKLVPVNSAKELENAIIQSLKENADRNELIKRGRYFSAENSLKGYVKLIENN